MAKKNNKQQKKMKNNGASVNAVKPPSNVVAMRTPAHALGLSSIQRNGSLMYAPVAVQARLPINRPSFSRGSSAASLVVSNREYISDLSGTSAFSLNSLSINPGLSAVFPWLSYFSMNYESYRFRKLRFRLTPIAATSSAGQMFATIDYDAADAAPSSKFDLLNQFAGLAMPAWEDWSYEADPRQERALGAQRYIRMGALSSNQDVKTYDVGVLYIGSQGFASTITACALFVEYEVELFTPNFSYAAIARWFSARFAASGSVSKTSFMGSSPTSIKGQLDVSASGNTLTFNRPGQYLVQITTVGTGLAAGVNPTISGTATSQLDVGTKVDSTTTGLVSYIVNALEKGATWIADFSAAATTITDSAVRVASYLGF